MPSPFSGMDPYWTDSGDHLLITTNPPRSPVVSPDVSVIEAPLVIGGGAVTLAAPLELPTALPERRYEKRPLCDIWPIALHQPLPVVWVPLLADDPDVAPDLQTHLPTSTML
jgi:hypothetical protein